MLEERGTVVEVRDDALWVETQSRSSCSHCSSSACTTSVVSKLFGVKRNRLQLPNDPAARVGDRVVIGIPDDLLVGASLQAYLLPVVSMLSAAAAGGAIDWGEGPQILLAVCGLILGIAWVRRMTRGRAAQKRYQPRLLRLEKIERVRIELAGL
jgi:sigma-E factor negative regulatory protein RseC